MGKETPATKDSVAHGDVRSKLHQKHQQQQKNQKEQARREKGSGVRWVKKQTHEEGKLWPLFESCLKDFLGEGETFRAKRDDQRRIVGLEVQEGKEWQSTLNAWRKDMSWYSVARKYKKGPGWTGRNMRDREQPSITDVSPRPETDILRITHELRPDHSRALLRQCEAEKTSEVKKLIEEFYWRSSAKWEELHPGRVGDHVGGHLNSGQVHRDLWHCGITEHYDETAPDNLRRDRVPYTSYGVGPGSTAFVRHLQVMMEAFGTTEDCASLTISEMDSNIAKAKKQNKCDPRDLAFNEWLDTWMWEEICKIDSDIAHSARLEYAEHVRGGYRAGKLGIQAKSAAEYEKELKALTEEKTKLEAELVAREAEISGLKSERENTSELVELGMMLADEMARDTEPEKWTSETSPLAANARSYLKWLKAGPERLLKHIEKLMAPLLDQLRTVPVAAEFLEFFGIQIPKAPADPSRQVGGSDSDIKING